VNLKDSAYTHLASGTLLETPGLWLGDVLDSIPSEGLALDSLGRYDEPATDAYQSVFSERMSVFWSRHKSLELIFTGSSHVYSGIDPAKISRYSSLSLGYPANGWLGQEEWISGYALNHCPKTQSAGHGGFSRMAPVSWRGLHLGKPDLPDQRRAI